MAGSSHRKVHLFGEINVTPLTDVFLVLLVIVMVVAPVSKQSDSDIRPPEINSQGASVDDEYFIQINKDGVYIVDGIEVDIDELTNKLEQLVATDNLRKAVIRADRLTKSSVVIEAMGAAKSAGIVDLTVIGEAQQMTRDDEAKSE